MYSILVILIVCIIFYLWYSEFYIFYNLLPYKNVNTKKLRNILIGIPTIDRDILKANNVYKSLYSSMKESENYNFDIIIITRESDTKSIEFWKNKCKVVIVPHYDINSRHNFEKLSDKFNILAEYSKKYDALVIIESDVYVKNDTITNLLYYLRFNHVTFCYGNIPWNNDEPYVIVPGFFKSMVINPRRLNAKNINAIGSWTGCVAIRSEVFTSCRFKVDYYNDIIGQDVGFYKELFKQRFKVFMLDDVIHDYK